VSCCCLGLVTLAPAARAQELETPAPAWKLADDLDAPQGDGRRTMGRFFPNLGRNFVGVFSRDNALPFLIGAGATAGGFLADGSSRSYFGAGRRFDDLGNAGQTIGGGTFVAPVAALFLAAGRFSSDSRFRAVTYDTAQALAVTGGWTFAFKSAAHRTRPDGSDQMSFPSGHASTAFAWATVANHHYGSRVGVPAYAVASLIGISRLEKNKHNVSDVLAGATIGFIVGRTVVREDGEPLARKPRFTLAPATDAQGHGLGLSLNLAF
jgi:membrane-associated phospholipid phosphatase